MSKNEMNNGECYVYSEKEDTWIYRYKEKFGLRVEIVKNYYLYPFKGHTLDEGMANSADENDEDYTGLLIPDAVDNEAEEKIEDEEEEDDGKLILSPFYGLARKEFLKENYPEYYQIMLQNGTLEDYLQDVERRACEMEDKLVKQYCEKEGVNNELKSKDFLGYVGLLNNITHCVREVVQEELIFV